MQNGPATTHVLVRGLPPFCWLDETQRARLMPAIRHRVYLTGQSFHGGTRSDDGVYVIVTGRVRLAARGVDGMPFCRRTLDRGDFVGTSGLIEGMPDVQVVHVIGRCEVLFTPQSALQPYLARNTNVLIGMIDLMLRRTAQAYDEILQFRSMNVLERLAAFLLDESRANTDKEGRLKIGTLEIARLIGASRESVLRGVNQLIATGAVVRLRKRLVVLSYCALEEILVAKAGLLRATV